ncbi:MAG: peptidoglycan-binding domain-containing protein, partial [Verrucomicrobia bacterium]|nr:peptidoglycan-binding domain-containing protein [Verrucomicrobiota bacterium]
MKKILLLSVLLAASALSVAKAEDSVRSAQAILQNSGYYTGAINGELNADTKAALRRYQIRNQLEPSGELTAETMAALNKEGRSAPAEAP